MRCSPTAGDTLTPAPSISRRSVVAALTAAAALGSVRSTYARPEIRQLNLNALAAFTSSGVLGNPPPVAGGGNPPPNTGEGASPNEEPQVAVVDGEVVRTLPNTGSGAREDGSKSTSSR